MPRRRMRPGGRAGIAEYNKIKIKISFVKHGKQTPIGHGTKQKRICVQAPQPQGSGSAFGGTDRCIGPAVPSERDHCVLEEIKCREGGPERRSRQHSGNFRVFQAIVPGQWKRKHEKKGR